MLIECCTGLDLFLGQVNCDCLFKAESEMKLSNE